MSLWKVLESKVLLKLGFFQLRTDRCELPDGRVMPNYYVLDFADWVNVVPLTDAGEVIAIRQYRHGSDRVHLEIPGGSTDPRSSEDPLLAARRELREETGYESAEWIHCGTHFPNPALQSNRLHTYLALGCHKVGEPELDPFEDLSVEIFPFTELKGRWENGEFDHSLIHASVGMALTKMRSRQDLGRFSTDM